MPATNRQESFATPMPVRSLLAQWHNRNLSMQESRELRRLQSRLTQYAAGVEGDVRARLLQRGLTNELAKRRL